MTAEESNDPFRPHVHRSTEKVFSRQNETPTPGNLKPNATSTCDILVGEELTDDLFRIRNSYSQEKRLSCLFLGEFDFREFTLTVANTHNFDEPE